MQSQVTSIRNHNSVAFVVLGKPAGDSEFEYFHKPGPLSSSEKILVSLMACQNKDPEEKINFCHYLQGCFVQYIRRGIEQNLAPSDIQAELEEDYKTLDKARAAMGYMSIGKTEFEVLAEEVIYNAKLGGWKIKNSGIELKSITDQQGCLSRFVYCKK